MPLFAARLRKPLHRRILLVLALGVAIVPERLLEGAQGLSLGLREELGGHGHRAVAPAAANGRGAFRRSLPVLPALALPKVVLIAEII